MLVKALTLSLCFLAATHVRADGATSARFTVQAFGVKIGEFQLIGSTDSRAYTTSGNFATTGLVSGLKNLRLALASTGYRKGAQFLPQLYTEQIQSGAKVAVVQMQYRDNVPALIGVRMDEPEVPDLNPRGQTDTVDPMTGVFMALRDQPENEACQLNQPMFDGTRRTRIVLRTITRRDGTLICSGHFDRLAGYPPEQMAKLAQSALQVTYAPGPGGQMQVQTAQMHSLIGPVILIRR